MEQKATAGADLWWKKGSSNDRELPVCCTRAIKLQKWQPCRGAPGLLPQCRTPEQPKSNPGLQLDPEPHRVSSRATVGMVGEKGAETVTSSVSGAISGDHGADVQYRCSPGNESSAHSSQLRNDQPCCQ
jgi:hypothetical protein